MAAAAFDHRDRRANRRGSLLHEYSDPYRQVFDAAVLAGVKSAQELSDAELAGLESYSGIVGLIAQNVLCSRRIAARRTVS